MPTNALWVGTFGNNIWTGRAGLRPRLIVNHVQMGRMAGTQAEFQSPQGGVSAHYALGHDGTVLQFVNENDTAWANGPIRHPNAADVPLIAWCEQHAINPNRLSFSIEWEGAHSGGRWVPLTTSDGHALSTLQRDSAIRWWVPTPVQLATGIMLIREIAGRWAIPLDRAHICRHSDFDSETKWFCPGDGFPLDTILAALAVRL